MKKILLLTAAAIIAVGFSSCKKDKDGDDNNASIVGTWVFSSIEIKSIEASPESFKNEIRNNIGLELPNISMGLTGKTFIFNEDGTGVDPNGDGFVYTYSKGVLKCTYNNGTGYEPSYENFADVTENALSIQYPFEFFGFGINVVDLPEEYSFTSCMLALVFTK